MPRFRPARCGGREPIAPSTHHNQSTHQPPICSPPVSRIAHAARCQQLRTADTVTMDSFRRSAAPARGNAASATASHRQGTHKNVLTCCRHRKPTSGPRQSASGEIAIDTLNLPLHANYRPHSAVRTDICSRVQILSHIPVVLASFRCYMFTVVENETVAHVLLQR